jgi:hypothetical protein
MRNSLFGEGKIGDDIFDWQIKIISLAYTRQFIIPLKIIKTTILVKIDEVKLMYEAIRQ